MCLEKFCGKMCRMHKSPINCLFHVIAGIVFIYALWQHSIELILVAFLIMVVGHIIQAVSIRKTGKLKKVKKKK